AGAPTIRTDSSPGGPSRSENPSTKRPNSSTHPGPSITSRETVSWGCRPCRLLRQTTLPSPPTISTAPTFRPSSEDRSNKPYGTSKLNTSNTLEPSGHHSSRSLSPCLQDKSTRATQHTIPRAVTNRTPPQKPRT